MRFTKKDVERIMHESKHRIETNKKAIYNIVDLCNLTADEKAERIEYEYRNMVSDLMFGVYGVLRLADNWITISNYWLDELETKYNIYDFER